MKRSFAALALAGISILPGACSKAVPSMADHSSADEKAIHAAELTWASDWSSGDLDKVLSHYADNAVVKLPGLPTMLGKDSIRPGIAKLLAGGGYLSMAFAPTGGGCGDYWASRHGTYSVALTNPKSGTQTQTGFYFADFVRIPGGS
jgi:hypothetical protein